jgi:hypothetical protein
VGTAVAGVLTSGNRVDSIHLTQPLQRVLASAMHPRPRELNLVGLGHQSDSGKGDAKCKMAGIKCVPRFALSRQFVAP